MEKLWRETASARQPVVPPPRLRCWLESAILAFGFPVVIWAISKLITLYMPTALHGSVEQRFLLHISGGLIAEWLFVIVLWFTLFPLSRILASGAGGLRPVG